MSSNESIKVVGRIIANAYEDFQEVRISSMNRFRDVIRKKIEGIPFDEVEEKKEGKTFEKKYTDKKLLEKWKEVYDNGLITKDEYEYVIENWGIMLDCKKIEAKQKKSMVGYISKEPVYIQFLSKVRGIGPVLSTNLIKEFGDCRVCIYERPSKEDPWKVLIDETHKNFELTHLTVLRNRDSDRYRITGYSTVSKLWANTGNGVDKDGKAPKRKKGESLKFSPRLRKLCWKISDSLLKQNKGIYRKVYDTTKVKQMNNVYPEGKLFAKYGKPYVPEDTQLKKLHYHNRALRKMRKIFLDHYWQASRELAGLPTEKNYVEGVLGHTHIIKWKEALVVEEEVREALAKARKKKKLKKEVEELANKSL